MYRLEHVGRRVPAAAWISRARLKDVPPRERRAILPVAPEFVVEIRSETDDLVALMDKMPDWVSDGVLLGLLLDPRTHSGYVFTKDRAEPAVISEIFTDQMFWLASYPAAPQACWQRDSLGNDSARARLAHAMLL